LRGEGGELSAWPEPAGYPFRVYLRDIGPFGLVGVELQNA
jgi:hypothetical protein